MSTTVSNIRRTRKDELLIELTRNNDPSTEDLRDVIQEALGDTRKMRIKLEIRNLDKTTEKEEVMEAIVSATNEGIREEITIVSWRKQYGGNYTTIAELSAPAHLLTDKGGLKIGWVICRVKERMESGVLRCYRCLDYGHIAARCTSAEDRTVAVGGVRI